MEEMRVYIANLGKYVEGGTCRCMVYCSCESG